MASQKVRLLQDRGRCVAVMADDPQVPSELLISAKWDKMMERVVLNVRILVFCSR